MRQEMADDDQESIDVQGWIWNELDIHSLSTCDKGESSGTDVLKWIEEGQQKNEYTLAISRLTHSPSGQSTLVSSGGGSLTMVGADGDQTLRVSTAH